MREGIDRLDRTVEAGFERTDKTIQQINEDIRGLYKLS